MRFALNHDVVNYLMITLCKINEIGWVGSPFPAFFQWDDVVYSLSVLHSTEDIKAIYIQSAIKINGAVSAPSPQFGFIEEFVFVILGVFILFPISPLLATADSAC